MIHSNDFARVFKARLLSQLLVSLSLPKGSPLLNVFFYNSLLFGGRQIVFSTDEFSERRIRLSFFDVDPTGCIPFAALAKIFEK